MEQIIIDFLQKNISNIEAIYIFGSFAENNFNKSSDIDIAYLSDTKISPVQKWKLANDLASILKRDIDLVDLKSANTIFKFQIVSKGERIFCKNITKVESFETLVWSFYIRFQEERRPIIEQILKDKEVLIYAK